MTLTLLKKMNNKSHPKQIVNGIILVNKPQGLTSNAVLQRVKHLFHAKKAGHTGSLDPLATGMLPLCFGEATKLSQFLLDADKCYEVTALLGIKTNTGDSMGEEISSVRDFSVSIDDVSEVVETFRGDISQIPPMFSALKHQGQPLYKLARAGKEVERKARKVSIHQIQIVSFDGKFLKLKVTCSKGTYIRTLVEDIGDKLGVGAHVTRLHRAYTAGFEDGEMYPLDDLMNKSSKELMDCLLPLDCAIGHLPVINLSKNDVFLIYQGRAISCSNVDEPLDSCVRLYDEDKNFVGLGEFASPGLLKGKRLLSQ
jgi:tRNA pseudouridine55 synthase